MESIWIRGGVSVTGCYTKGQIGLFHIKISGDQAVTNEFWGKPNSKCPWSLWKVNSLLGRKAIAASWKSKTLPPFCPTWELILKMALPAHILNAYRLLCSCSTVEEWVSAIKTREEVQQMAKKNPGGTLLTPSCILYAPFATATT